MPRRGENIFKRKDGRWEARYAVEKDGRSVYRSVYGRSYCEAKEKRRLAVSLLESAEEETEAIEPCSFEGVALRWLEEIRLSVKESTLTRYHRSVFKYLIPYFKGKEITEVDNRTIAPLTEALLSGGGKRGAPLSPKTVGDVLCVLKSIIIFAIGEGYSVKNEKMRYPLYVKRDACVLSRESRKKLEAVLKNASKPAELGILLALFTGLRIGEVCGLKWEDVDLVNFTLSVRRTVARISDISGKSEKRTKIVISEPKTQSSVRIIPIPQFLSEILRKNEGEKENYLLTNSERITEPHSFYLKYKRFLRINGIENYSFHALRHSFATKCVELGFDAKTLSSILGHSSVSTTLQIYVHPSLEQKREQMNKLSMGI